MGRSDCSKERDHGLEEVVWYYCTVTPGERSVEGVSNKEAPVCFVRSSRQKRWKLHHFLTDWTD